ncbi:uncharacterized protein LOC124892597 [Capsicum annuum]|uniref:uncharacterized protein LOC124892597 n=1 Tax=Capsicum annuum TaxID=4072 RepID=UPI001FB05E93|nr:uncharacterized protein LOC124892597 [Capsicum annuum]
MTLIYTAVAQDMENHIYSIAFCVVDKENDASWTFFFGKLKSIVIDGLDLCFISNRHKSIANGIAKVYNHAHHGYCMRYLGENLWVNHHCGEHLFLFYNVAKTYSSNEVSDYFVEFKNYCPETTFFLEHDLGFEKWSRAYFPGKRERRAYVLKYKERKFVPIAEKILRDNMSEGDSFYVENISGDEKQYTVFKSGCTTKVDLPKRSYSCWKFDLVKISCNHAMVALRSKHNEDYGLRVYDYSSPLYKVEEYLLAYSESVNVVPLEFE